MAAESVNDTFNSPIYTNLDFSLTYHGQNREELELQARVIPWGKFVQKIDESKKGYSFDLWPGFVLSYLCQEAGYRLRRRQCQDY